MDKLIQIFEKQRQLAHDFHIIECANGVCEPGELRVDPLTLKGQERLRSLAWRVIEELAEALDERSVALAKEEIVDVGHYLIELLLVADIEVGDIRARMPAMTELDGLDALFALETFGRTTSPPLDLSVSYFVTSLGMALHQLKHKPHKVKPKPTNVREFRLALIASFSSFVRLLVSARISADEFYEGYLQKNQVNHDRIATMQ